MTRDPLQDIVSAQYERWIYPQPIDDLPEWLNSNWQWFDPIHAHHVFWPDRDYWPGMDILVAGCGTNQAAVIAYTNPQAKITALDVSQSSLNHHHYLKQKYGLDNLELHRLPIENVSTLGRDFDLIISTGVLHHLENPQKGLDALAPCLRPHGVMALMLYAYYGRIGLEIMQSVFRDLGLKQDEPSILMVRDALASLPREHPVWTYIQMAPDLQFDAGLVDTFLHGREKSYTIPECIDFVKQSHLVFQDLFFKAPYYPYGHAKSAFFSSIATFNDEQQWSMMERLNFRNGCHYFLACGSGRDKAQYHIDWTSTRADQYKPTFRFKCGIDESSIFRADWRMPLDQKQLSVLRCVDGRHSIEQIVNRVAKQGAASPNNDEASLGRYTFELFHALWKLDFIAMKI